VSVESERTRRVGLRSQSQSELRVRDVDTTIGGTQKTQSTPINTGGANKCSQRRGAVKKTGNWTDAILKQAMDAITDKGMKVRVAARTFGIPTTSLRDHLYGRVMGRKRGTKTMLNQEEEGKLFDYCFKMQDLGHPLTSGN
jgi:hypothetical protein